MSHSFPSGRVLALLASLSTVAACASLGTRRAAPALVDLHYRGAVAALDSADFPAARSELSWLVSRCSAGPRGRRALLLFASAELDARNPDRSPDRAARLAARFLEIPGAPAEDLPVARSLYLMALDLGGAPGGSAPPEGAGADSLDTALPPLALRFQQCDDRASSLDSAALPVYPGPTAARRMTGLERLLRVRTDSLQQARADAAEQDRRLEELQAEIERIRKLLKGGGGAPPDTMRP